MTRPRPSGSNEVVWKGGCSANSDSQSCYSFTNIDLRDRAVEDGANTKPLFAWDEPNGGPQSATRGLACDATNILRKIQYQ